MTPYIEDVTSGTNVYQENEIGVLQTGRKMKIGIVQNQL